MKVMFSRVSVRSQGYTVLWSQISSRGTPGQVKVTLDRIGVLLPDRIGYPIGKQVDSTRRGEYASNGHAGLFLFYIFNLCIKFGCTPFCSTQHHQRMKVETRELFFKLSDVMGCSQSVQKHLSRLVNSRNRCKSWLPCWKYSAHCRNEDDQ